MTVVLRLMQAGLVAWVVCLFTFLFLMVLFLGRDYPK